MVIGVVTAHANHLRSRHHTMYNYIYTDGGPENELLWTKIVNGKEISEYWSCDFDTIHDCVTDYITNHYSYNAHPQFYNCRRFMLDSQSLCNCHLIQCDGVNSCCGCDDM